MAKNVNGKGLYKADIYFYKYISKWDDPTHRLVTSEDLNFKFNSPLELKGSLSLYLNEKHKISEKISKEMEFSTEHEYGFQNHFSLQNEENGRDVLYRFVIDNVTYRGKKADDEKYLDFKETEKLFENAFQGEKSKEPALLIIR